MKKLVTIGEALIDFIPSSNNKLKDVESFRKECGGAPCNVASAYSILGGTSTLLTKLGDDPFADYIIDTLNSVNVNTKYIVKDKSYDTSLAFVALTKDGARDFKFYRKTAADLNYSIKDIPNNILELMDIIHFCSIDLVESNMKYATKEIIDIAIKNNKIISFDPNLRPLLWNNLEDLKQTVLEFISYSNILKISDEELEFITGTTDIYKASKMLFNKYKRLEILLYSMGKDGALLITRVETIMSNKYKVKAVDTTGAGDGFIGSFLFYYYNLGLSLTEALNKATLFASKSTTKYGAINSYKN